MLRQRKDANFRIHGARHGQRWMGQYLLRQVSRNYSIVALRCIGRLDMVIKVIKALQRYGQRAAGCHAKR